MSDIVKRLEIKAGVMEMGERIAWGSDTALMREAAHQITTLTAEVARLTGGLAEVAAALPGPVYMDPPDGGDVSLAEQVRRMAAELEKEVAHSKHLAGAVSRKIEDLIAVENQCGYYKTQYSRAEKVRKEACEANAKAQAAMLWLEADLERSRRECERLRSLTIEYLSCLGYADLETKLAKDLAALSASGREGE